MGRTGTRTPDAATGRSPDEARADLRRTLERNTAVQGERADDPSAATDEPGSAPAEAPGRAPARKKKPS